MRPHIVYKRGKASAVARFEQAQADRGSKPGRRRAGKLAKETK